MPVTYEIDQTRGIIRTKCSGEVTFDEVLDHFRVLQRDPECPACLDVLLDLSECTSEPDTPQLRTVTYAIGKVRDRVQFEACAIVVPTDLMFGIAQIFAAFAEEQFRAIEVFRSISEAEEWLSSQQSSGRAR